MVWAAKISKACVWEVRAWFGEVAHAHDKAHNVTRQISEMHALGMDSGCLLTWSCSAGRKAGSCRSGPGSSNHIF